MKSLKIGKSTSKAKAEVLNVSSSGIWVLIKDHEYFLAHKDFPWFKQATIGEINNLKFLNDCHLHWPDLDVDLELESLKSLEKYPLIYR